MAPKFGFLQYPKLYLRKPRAVQNNVAYRSLHTTIKQDAKMSNVTSIGPIAVNVGSLSPKAQKIHQEVHEFVREIILPVEQALRNHTESEDWMPDPKMEELKVTHSKLISMMKILFSSLKPKQLACGTCSFQLKQTQRDCTELA